MQGPRARSQPAVHSLADVQSAVPQLARTRQRLGTDLNYFTAQASRLSSIEGFLKGMYMGTQRHLLRQALLHKSMGLLTQLLQIAAACLQQLKTQVFLDVSHQHGLSPALNFCKTTLELSVLCATRENMAVGTVRVMTAGEPTALNRDVVRMLQNTGVLAAYSAAARAFSQRMTQLLQQGHRVPLSQGTQGPDMMGLAAAIGAVLVGIWTSWTMLLPMGELMQPGYEFDGTLQPTAAMAVRVMRAFAPLRGDTRAQTATQAVMSAALFIAHTVTGYDAAVYATVTGSRTGVQAGWQGLAQTRVGALRSQDVLELLLVAMGVCCEVLHADYQGLSQQVLLKSLAGAVASTATSESSTVAGSTGARNTTSSSGGCRSGTSRRMAVPPHHQELLHALLGVRELSHCFTEPHMVEKMLADTQCVITAVHSSLAAWGWDQASQDVRSSSSSSSTDKAKSSSSSRQEAAPKAPWAYVLQMQLVFVELLALAPPFFAQDLHVLNAVLTKMMLVQQQLDGLQHQLDLQAQQAASRDRRRSRGSSSDSSSSSSGRPLASAAPLDPGHSRALAQRCLQSLWLHLGPVLLSLCRRHAGEAEGEAGGSEGPEVVVLQTIPGLTPRDVFATYDDVLLTASNGKGGGVGDIAAVIKASPHLCCMTAEAAMHALPALIRDPQARGAGRPGEEVTSTRVQMAGFACYSAAMLVRVLAEAGANLLPASNTAAAQQGQDKDSPGPPLLAGLFASMAAVLKLALNTPPAAAGEPFSRDLLQNRLGLVDSVLRAGIRMLGHAEASHVHLHNLPKPSAPGATLVGACLSMEQQLAMFALLARGLAVAASVIQEVPLQFTAAGGFAVPTAPWPEHGLYNSLGVLVADLRAAVAIMHEMLQPGVMVHAAVGGGAEAAGTTSTGLEGLRQQGVALQDSLAALDVKGSSSSDASTAQHQNSASICSTGSLSEQQLAANATLHAACLPSSELLDQLLAFAGGCYAAFPQPRCCGNSTCSNLDKLSEAALAANWCSGCKAVKFCSPQCSKAAWNSGHKAACAVLKQHQSPAAPTTLDSTAGTTVQPTGASEPDLTASSERVGGLAAAAAAPAGEPAGTTSAAAAGNNSARKVGGHSSSHNGTGNSPKPGPDGQLPCTAAGASSLRAAQLKSVLGQLGVSTQGAVEKAELVQLLCKHLHLS